MTRRLYYVIEKELQLIDTVEEATGFKTIRVYEIENDRPSNFCEINDVSIEDNSRKEIQDWLDDNGYGDETFDLINL